MGIQNRHAHAAALDRVVPGAAVDRRQAQLRQEAAAIEADLRAGKWQLDRTSFLHAAGQLSHWLGSDLRAGEEAEALAGAVDWLHKKWAATPPGERNPSGVQFFASGNVAVLWVSTPDRLAALLAGPDYMQANWLGPVQQAAAPARVSLAGPGGAWVAGNATPVDVRRVQRSAADTGLPWTVVVTDSDSAAGNDEFAARRRMLLAGLALILLLTAAGSYFIWRSVNRELAVAGLQSDFVSAVSHEFRTPLTALRQFNELLADEEEVPAEKRRSYHQAQTRATERLHRLVEALLDFGRMEAGRRPYRFERLDAGALASDVTEEFRAELDGRGFSVECRVDNTSAECGVRNAEYHVSADSEALSRAVWNLLDNAVKYSGEGRSIQVAVGRSGPAVSISVRDQGIGIPLSEQRSIFQKFVRGAAAKSLGIKGTGIGLAIVRRIVDAHGGEIRLESGPGRGRRFTILLPHEEIHHG